MMVIVELYCYSSGNGRTKEQQLKWLIDQLIPLCSTAAADAATPPEVLIPRHRTLTYKGGARSG